MIFGGNSTDYAAFFILQNTSSKKYVLHVW